MNTSHVSFFVYIVRKFELNFLQQSDENIPVYVNPEFLSQNC